MVILVDKIPESYAQRQPPSASYLCSPSVDYTMRICRRQGTESPAIVARRIQDRYSMIGISSFTSSWLRWRCSPSADAAVLDFTDCRLG